MQIAFIGGGAMAEAMVRGILGRGLVMADDIIVSDISAERRSHLSQQYGVVIAPDNRSAAEKGKVVVLAVKPQTLPEVMEELKGRFQLQQLVLSIVAGVPLASIRHGLSHETIARAMPNMPAQIGEGVSVWTAASEANEQHRQKARSILGALGKELFVPDEKYIDMATAVSGSGPALIFMVIESLVDAAVHIGLPREMAEQLVLQTVLGSAQLVQQTQRPPAELRAMVTSPGGTTAEGLLQLERGDLRGLISQAVDAAYARAKELGGR